MGTIDPVKIAYTDLMDVFEFLNDKAEKLKDDAFEDQAEKVAGVLEQLVGYCGVAAHLGPRYPDNPNVKWDVEFWKKNGGNGNVG